MGKTVKQASRCCKSQKRQAPVCPCLPAGNGFLKYRFQPLAGNEAIPYKKGTAAALQAAFQNLSALYGFEPLDVSEQPFPYNLYLSFNQVQNCLKEADKELDLLLLEDGGRIRLATVKTASTGTTLFYIPVYPLWQLLQDSTRKQEARLLLSVFSYLHCIAGIPYFDGCTYIGNEYMMLEEWLETEDVWDEVEYSACLSELKQALYFGKRMQRQISHPYHLQDWENRLNRLTIWDSRMQALHEVAEQLLHLYRRYPHKTLFDNVHPEITDPQEDQRMCMEQVFSFIWNEQGLLAEHLLDMVSSELNELNAADEPMTLQFFDTPQQQATHDLQFEQSLYELLYDLSDVIRCL